MAYNEDVNVNLNVLTGTMGGITAIMGGMSALTSSFGALGTTAAESFGTLDGLLVTSTALISTFAIQSAEAFGQYEQGMKIVQTVSGQTSYAMNELSNKANEMSIAYRSSIGDITEGLQTLGRAGLNSVNEQLEVLESGLQTAKLEGRNLNGVLEEIIQNTAMLGGDLKSVNFGEQAEYLNSLMVGTSMTAPITSHDISQTLQYAGGTAAAAGANLDVAGGEEKIEDLMGTIAAFAQKGVKGSMAGTALRAFFTKPASQDTSVVDALATLNLDPSDLWEDGGESMKKVSDQIGIIKNRMEDLNMSTMDQVELWGKIVGPKMGQQMMKLDAASVKELTRDIQSANSAEELAQQTLYTYTQQLSEMQQQGDLAFREFGQKVVQFLQPVAWTITQVLGLLSDPHINFAAFATIGSLLAHGFRKAWAMITTVFAQIKGLVTEVVTGIESINSLAGGSAPGFAQGASQVEFLNAKLLETDAVLQSIQAKSMGIKPGYQLPLGLYTDKVPKRTFKAYGENVVVDRAGVMGKGQGAILSGENEKILKTRLNEFGQQMKNETVNRMPGFMGGGKAFGQDAIDKGVDKYVKGMTDESVSKVRTELKMFDKSEYKQWLSRQEARGEVGKYSLRRAGDFYTSDGKVNYSSTVGQQYGKELERLAKKGLYVVPESHLAAKTHPNAQVLGQALNDGTVDKMAERRSQILEQQKRQLLGQTGWNAKAYQEGEKGFRSFSNALNKSSTAVSSFGSKVKQIPNMISNWRERRGRGAEFWTGTSAASGNLNLIDYQKRAQNILQSQSFISANKGADISTVAANLRRELNVTATEFAALVNTEEQFRTVFGETTNFTAEQFRELGGMASLVKDEMAKMIITEEEEAMAETEAGAEVIAAKKAEASASIQAAAADEAEAATSAASGLSGALSAAGRGLSTIVGYMGGPLMAAMMGFTFVTQQINEQQQKWQESMQDASNQLSEAKDSITQSSETLKDIYSSEYNNMSDSDLEKITDYQYAAIMQAYDTKGTKAKFSDMYNNEIVKVENLSWTKEERDQYKIKTSEELEELNANAETISLTGEENIKALEENTVSLKSAAAQYAQALQKVANSGSDGIWGFRGSATDFSEGKLFIPGGLGGLLQATNYIKDYLNKRDNGFLDSNSPVLSASQSDKNYAFGTDFASIFLANSNRFDVEEGLSSFFGNDYDKIIGMMGGIHNEQKIQTAQFGAISNPAQLLTSYGNYFHTIPESDAALAMAFMKDNPDDMSKLGKQIFRQEQQYNFKPGITASGNYGAIKAGYHPSGQPLQVSKTKSGATLLGTKDLKSLTSNISKAKLTVQDQNLKATVNKFREMTGNKLSEQTILMMGNLQMLSDMNKVAQEQVAPGITQTVQTAGQIMNGTFEAAGYAGSASTGAGGAAANAYAIAVFLQAQAQESSTHAQYEKYLRDPNAERSWFGFGGLYDEKEFNNMISQKGSPMYEKYGKPALEQAAIATSMLTQPGRTYEEHLAAGKRSLQKVEEESNKYGTNFQDMMNTVTKGMPEALQKQVMSAYDQSNIGEYGSGSGSGGGGSGGGGSGKGSGSDSGSGTRKERVDLVLCNKKEIPKLNVNLFKKPPNFTILNKNFKLRDIKINSQDKPKAIMNAIKNGIIETQKRMDPKIIQDDVAEFDPVSATEGNSVPKGNTKTTT